MTVSDTKISGAMVDKEKEDTSADYGMYDKILYSMDSV